MMRCHPERFTPEEDRFIRDYMAKRLQEERKVYVAAIEAAEELRRRFGVKHNSESVKRRWYKIKNIETENSDETLSYITSLARKLMVLEGYIAEQNRMIRSLLKQLELATRCIALLKGCDAE